MNKFCVGLELAKDLKDAGFPELGYQSCYYSGIGYLNLASSDEILEQLPKEDYQGWNFMMCFCKGNWRVGYGEYGDFICHKEEDKKLSNALAKLYIWLKKEGNIK